MSRLAPLAFLAVAAGLLPAAAAAENLAFVHDATLYWDVKEKPIKQPEGVACGAAGEVTVADTGNGRLLKYTVVEGSVRGGTEVKLAQLPVPFRLQYAKDGSLVALDRKSRRLVKVTAAGGFGGYLDVKDADRDVVVGGFKLDSDDNLFVLDIAGRRILLANPAGSVSKALPLPKDPGAVFTDVAVDLAGNVYVVDAVAAVVWVSEKGTTEFKALTKSLKDRMNFPTYLVAARGRLYLVDTNGSGVVILGADGAFQGRQLSIGWSDGLVNYPSQLCLAEGQVVVADRFNNRVQVFLTGK